MGLCFEVTPTADVDEYIRSAPIEVQAKLRQLRAAILGCAPEAVERISYGMPFYEFANESGFRGRLCYFVFAKKRIVFYTRPRFLEEYIDEARPYASAKSALHFPIDHPIPVQLVKKIVKHAVRSHHKETEG